MAAELHDGVVQQLVGASLSLSAAAEEAERGGLPSVAYRVAAASSELRQSVRDLRSLIVAIAPPRLHDEGLAAALGDLVSPLAARGIEAGAVRLEVRDDGVGFSPGVLASRQAAGHVGLHLLSQLADEAGGRLQVDGRPGHGTSVELEVPVG